jgi:hypothetical protein
LALAEVLFEVWPVATPIRTLHSRRANAIGELSMLPAEVLRTDLACCCTHLFIAVIPMEHLSEPLTSLHEVSRSPLAMPQMRYSLSFHYF